ncbi:MAG: O-antigen ligase family protein [Mariprofundaceae bacterium]|nr:O-antigen ligase family protein [Mariprofundaceae bacterium]
MNPSKINSQLTSKVLLLGLTVLGASLSLTIAVVNTLLALALLYMLACHRDFMLKQAQQPYIRYILASALLFQCIELIHDGLIVSKAGKLLLIFALTLMLGKLLNSMKIPYFNYLFLSMAVGLIAGTIINQYLNPHYPLWATYSMTYANQAAGLAITIGLLSLVSKKWWIIVPSLAGMLLYTYMSGERAAILAFAGALLILLFLLRKYKILTALTVITITFFSFLPSTTIQQQYEHNVRFDIWHHGILIAQQDHFLGRGEKHQLNQSELDLYKSYATGPGLNYFQRAMPDKPTAHYNVLYHNQYIQYLVEYGILGLIIFLIFLCVPITHVWRQKTIEFPNIVFIMIWTAFAIHCMFETSFDNHTAIILGLLSGLMLPQKHPTPELPKASHQTS